MHPAGYERASSSSCPSRRAPIVAAHGGSEPNLDGETDTQKQARAPMKGDRKSTRLNSSHSQISYAVFCLKKKNLEDGGLIPAHETAGGPHPARAAGAA